MTKNTHSAGGIILNKQNQIVIVQQKHRTWSFPKGHLEKNETELDAAYREIYEECGLKKDVLDYVRELPVYSRYKIGLDQANDISELKTLHFFLFRTDEHSLQPKDPENPVAKWIEKEEVPNYLTHEKDILFFEEVLTLL